VLPPDSVIVAAARWIRLLERSPLATAAAVVRNDAAYTDLSTTQYGVALDWLRTTGLVDQSGKTRITTTDAKSVEEILLSTALAEGEPPWLQDADLLVRAAIEIPEDAASLGDALGLTRRDVFRSIRRAHGLVDLTRRSEIGRAGERALVAFLEERAPGSTYHVAAEHDGFGYDIEFLADDGRWLLEVKATTRRGRLAIHLSRNEYEVGTNDGRWRLVVVGLTTELELTAVATVRTDVLSRYAPRDESTRATWQSARFDLGPDDLEQGLPFVAARATELSSSPPHDLFAWFPQTPSALAMTKNVGHTGSP
jgi:hypothetical protein